MQSIKKRSLVVLSFMFLAIIVDQVIKIAVKTNMSLGENFSVFGDWFKIYFIENNGMAFGMELFNKIFLTSFRVVAVGFLGYILYRLLKNIKYPIGFVMCVALILSGAIGNIIDCLFYGEIFTSSYGRVAEFVAWGEGYGSFMEGRVVDMFYFPLFTWPEWVPMLGGDVFFAPVFNFADSCITCSVAVMLVFYRKYLLD